VTVSAQASSEGLHFGCTDVIGRVRELDPECSTENVERFFREIDAAAQVLHQIDASQLPLPIAYDPRWPQDPRE
jgi:hypothetical protein